MIMLKHYNPGGIAAPFSRYSHGVEAPHLSRWLHISGQVGVLPDGTMAEGAEAQMVQAWRNLFAVLHGAGMARQDLVKVTSFLTRTDDVKLFREVRDRMLAGAAPASTMLIVAGLAHAHWLVEIEAIAAGE
jgi:enamine deaminase RidA (YjgF/YER057c/UK114 family)